VSTAGRVHRTVRILSEGHSSCCWACRVFFFGGTQLAERIWNVVLFVARHFRLLCCTVLTNVFVQSQMAWCLHLIL
jgi:hypothetical protein